LYQKAVDLGLDSKISYEKITPAINLEFFKSNIDKDLHNPLRILTVGRLTWKKGYEYALKALVLLKNAQINFEYHIVGEGHYREAIMYSIYQLGLTKNVMLAGQIAPVEVKNEMEWADIYIQPSIQEGFCNAVLEAQAMGLLCIVTDADGLSENVLDGKTGWVVPKRSPEELSKKIINILTMDDDRLNQIRKYAAKRVINEFNLEFQSQLFRDFYY
jgi:colanic acid/amylovoran biosynthesis glycosyltransferase